MERVRRAVAACDASPSAPVVIFVSKMIPVKKRDITDTDGKLWRPPAGLSEEEKHGGDGEDDRDALAFVAFARVLSGTVTPDTPLLVSGLDSGLGLLCIVGGGCFGSCDWISELEWGVLYPRNLDRCS